MAENADRSIEKLEENDVDEAKEIDVAEENEEWWHRTWQPMAAILSIAPDMSAEVVRLR